MGRSREGTWEQEVRKYQYGGKGWIGGEGRNRVDEVAGGREVRNSKMGGSRIEG